jgi:hypothetical protein
VAVAAALTDVNVDLARKVAPMTPPKIMAAATTEAKTRVSVFFMPPASAPNLKTTLESGVSYEARPERLRPGPMAALQVFVNQPAEGLVLLGLAALEVEREADAGRNDDEVDRAEPPREPETSADEVDVGE